MVCNGCCRTRATVPGPEISVRNYPMSQNCVIQNLRFSSKEMRENIPVLGNFRKNIPNKARMSS